MDDAYSAELWRQGVEIVLRYRKRRRPVRLLCDQYDISDSGKCETLYMVGCRFVFVAGPMSNETHRDCECTCLLLRHVDIYVG